MALHENLTVTIEQSIAEIPATEWDRCANPPASGDDAPSQQFAYNPFISHAFLLSLEESGSAVARTGWLPEHHVVRDEEGTVLAVMPAYMKSHSQGEYVFDHGWADAYEQAGGSYYPKLQVSVPFTPATGRRLLAAPGPQADMARRALAAGALQFVRRAGISSIHATFLPEDEWRLLTGLGFLARTDQQFHWRNEGYASFEAFLETLASRKRKTIRRERRGALEAGIEIEWVTGRDLTEAHWDAFFGFYMDTGSRKWGRPYLTRTFFSLVGERLADRTLLIMARRGGRYIAGALNFIGGDTLYGRNWGCVEDHPFLHFETCYYQAIDFAIARGLKRVEAGAQGEHKLARGYEPSLTYSAHFIADPALRRAVAHYLERERAYVDAAQGELETMTPFKRG